MLNRSSVMTTLMIKFTSELKHSLGIELRQSINFYSIILLESFPFHLFYKENGCQNATVNNAIKAVLKYTNVKVD